MACIPMFPRTRTCSGTDEVWGTNRTTVTQWHLASPVIPGLIPEAPQEPISRRHLKLVWNATGSGYGNKER